MDFEGFVREIIDLINLAIPVLIGIALVLFFAGVVRFLYRSGDHHTKTEDREILVWGLVAIFVLVSVWGIVNFLKESFLG